MYLQKRTLPLVNYAGVPVNSPHIHLFSVTACPVQGRGGPEPIPEATDARYGTTQDGVCSELSCCSVTRASFLLLVGGFSCKVSVHSHKTHVKTSSNIIPSVNPSCYTRTLNRISNKIRKPLNVMMVKLFIFIRQQTTEGMLG